MQDQILVALAQQASLFDLQRKSERERSSAAVTRLFMELQAVLCPSFTIEFGAYDAAFSIAMRKQGVQAIALEANPHNFRKFSATKEIIEAGVEYIYSAISDHVGHVEFHIQEARRGVTLSPIRGNNSILRRNEDGVEYETVSVPCQTLDHFLSSIGAAGRGYSAWIDVEGATRMVIDGAKSSLQNCMSLLIEVEQIQYWSQQMLDAEVIMSLDKLELIPIVRDFQYEKQYNLLFVARSVLQRGDVRECVARYFSSCSFGRSPP